MDDLDAFREFCEFGPERVYLLLAIARAKENEGVRGNSAPVLRRIVEDADDLERTAAELDHAAGRFDHRFRLYLTANARNVTKACFELRRRMDDWLEMRLNGNDEVLGKFRRVDAEFRSVLQSDGCRDETNLLFDLDGAATAEADAFTDRLAERTTVSLARETPNGYHVVAEPFDYTEFDADVAYELKTDGLVFVSRIGE